MDGIIFNGASIHWNGVYPVGIGFARIYYQLQRMGQDHILDKVCSHEMREYAAQEHGAGFEQMDGIVIEARRVESTAQAIMRLFNQAASGDANKPNCTGFETDQFKRNATTNVLMAFSFTDGQTVSVFFHNPDVTPNKINPTDELVSWKWMLNRQDITVAVSPESGKEVAVRTVAQRVIKLVHMNSDKFKKRNADYSARVEKLAQVEGQVTESRAAIQSQQAMNEQLQARVLEQDSAIKDLQNKLKSLKDAESARQMSKPSATQSIDEKFSFNEKAIAGLGYGFNFGNDPFETTGKAKNFASRLGISLKGKKTLAEMEAYIKDETSNVIVKIIQNMFDPIENYLKRKVPDAIFSADIDFSGFDESSFTMKDSSMIAKLNIVRGERSFSLRVFLNFDGHSYFNFEDNGSAKVLGEYDLQSMNIPSSQRPSRIINYVDFFKSATKGIISVLGVNAPEYYDAGLEKANEFSKKLELNFSTNENFKNKNDLKYIAANACDVAASIFKSEVYSSLSDKEYLVSDRYWSLSYEKMTDNMERNAFSLSRSINYANSYDFLGVVKVVCDAEFQDGKVVYSLRFEKRSLSNKERDPLSMSGLIDDKFTVRGTDIEAVSQSFASNAVRALKEMENGTYQDNKANSDWLAEYEANPALLVDSRDLLKAFKEQVASSPMVDDAAFKARIKALNDQVAKIMGERMKAKMSA